MPNTARLLGFAFASADFLFETDTAGTVLFAAGAAKDLVHEQGDTLLGQPAGRLFMPSEGVRFSAFAKALRMGVRAGPFRMRLANGGEARLAMFLVPDNDSRICCTLTRPESDSADAPVENNVLASRVGFLAAAENAGNKDVLTLVDVPGLAELCAQLPADQADQLLQRIGDSLNNSGASAAGQLSDSGFGALSPKDRGGLNLAQKIRDVVATLGLKPLKVAETLVGLEGAGLSPEQRLLSMRYVIGRFADGGKFQSSDGDIAGAFAGMMEETQKRLAAMTETVGKGAFEIAYQPIRDLVTGKLSHYEALARFNNPQGTGETVKFIEELGISNIFDLAVASKVLDVIENSSETQIAFNISGATLSSPASFGVLAAMLMRRRKLAQRTLIEVTETSAIADLDSAGKAIMALRGMGYRVGLDDFGAGAASLNYLHAFQVDFVKFDGAMIQKIGNSKRDDALLGGMAKLCGEMNVVTIAEWIENERMAKAAAAMGFHHGQGKWLGAPSKELPDARAQVGKRKGVTESWG